MKKVEREMHLVLSIPLSDPNERNETIPCLRFNADLMLCLANKLLILHIIQNWFTFCIFEVETLFDSIIAKH